ncbi:MAG: hypothetical protein JWR35_1104 [Marmoricola sp.]|nr:hypothetical protein [Marmoricola sp.]
MIVVVGESLVDVVIDVDGDTTEAVGGSPLNVAVGLARLDVPTILITQAGTDERGGRIVNHVSASGAEIIASPGPNSTATARLDRLGGATYDFDIEWSLPHQELPACDALHLGSLGALIEPGRNSVLDLFDQAYARGVFISYDPNIREPFLDDRTEAWRQVELIADRSTLVKLSDQDVELLQPGADLEDIARSLLAGERTELVVITRGADGATAYVTDGSVSVEAPEIVVVDTVGAGDAFMAATLAILFESDAMGEFGAGVPTDEADLRRLLQGAVEVAALTCLRRGADSPLRSDLPNEWPD